MPRRRHPVPEPLREWLDSFETSADRAAAVRAIARRLSISEAGVRHYFTGERKIPAENVLSISEETGVPPHQIAPNVYPEPVAATN